MVSLPFVYFLEEKLSEKLGITIKRSSTNYKLPNVMTRVNTVKPKIKQFELRAGDPSDSLDAPSQMEKVGGSQLFQFIRKLCLFQLIQR